jgi:hypothetical protein
MYRWNEKDRGYQKDKGPRCYKHVYSHGSETNHRISLTHKIQESSCEEATWELSARNNGEKQENTSMWQRR